MMHAWFDGSRRVRRAGLIAAALMSVALSQGMLFTSVVEQRVVRAPALELAALAGAQVLPWCALGLCVIDRRLNRGSIRAAPLPGR